MISLEEEILKLGQENPLSDAQVRSMLKRTLVMMRENHPDDLDGRSDDEIIEEIMKSRRTELAFVSGLVRSPK